MARTDLLLQLVQSGSKGDRPLFRKVVEAIISEERSKQHNILANKLQASLNLLNQSNNNSNITFLNGNRTENKAENFISESIPTFRLTDLILDDYISSTCLELVQEHNRVDLLRSYNLEPRNRILLIGPPGNGKTSLAEAMANELMVPFYSVKYESIITSYLGETSSRLKLMFDFIKTQQCVLFFDEFDSISKERGDTHETGEIKRLVSALLLQIDKLPSYVVIIAATNHPELLDKAVWRRFQVRLSLPKPSESSIQEFLAGFQSKFDISFGYSLSHLAKALSSLSFSEISDFCLDILRRSILNSSDLSRSTIKAITSQRLASLRKTHRPKK